METYNFFLEVVAYGKRFPKGHAWVIPRIRTRGKVVWNAHFQARRFVDPLCRNDDASLPRKWRSCLSQQVRWTRGSLKSKKGGKLSIHCEGDSSTAEL